MTANALKLCRTLMLFTNDNIVIVVSLVFMENCLNTHARVTWAIIVKVYIISTMQMSVHIDHQVYLVCPCFWHRGPRNFWTRWEMRTPRESSTKPVSGHTSLESSEHRFPRGTTRPLSIAVLVFHDDLHSFRVNPELLSLQDLIHLFGTLMVRKELAKACLSTDGDCRRNSARFMAKTKGAAMDTMNELGNSRTDS